MQDIKALVIFRLYIFDYKIRDNISKLYGQIYSDFTYTVCV